MAEPACQSRFERLMGIADQYARHLSGGRTRHLPQGVLLLEREGKLHTVVLGGSQHELARMTRELVLRHRVTSAALILSLPTIEGGDEDDRLYILGESAEGEVDERRYRVRSGFGRRRLIPLDAVGEAGAAGLADGYRPFFLRRAISLLSG